MENGELFPNRALLKLLLPLTVEQLMGVTIGTVGALLVATEGEAAVSGVSLVDAINILLIQVFAALATGGAVVSAQYIGRQERGNACLAAKQLVYASAMLSAAIAAICLIFSGHILHGVFGRIDQSVMRNAEIYFTFSALSYPALAVYNAGAALFRAMGDSKTSMKIAILINLVNLAVGALTVFAFKWGVAGVATALLLARLLGAVMIIWLIRDPQHPIFIPRLFRPEFSLKMIRRILNIGVPNGLENGMFQVGKLIVQTLISTFGTAAIAANAIANTITSVVVIPGSAIGLGLLTVVGQCAGARAYDDAARYTGKLMAVTVALLSLIGALTFAFARPIVSLFHLSAEATGLSVLLLRWYSVVCVAFWPPAFTLVNVLRASGDAKFTMVVSILSMWIFRVGLSYLLAGSMGMGVLGVWIAMFIDWIVRGGVFVLRFFSGKWKSKRVI